MPLQQWKEGARKAWAAIKQTESRFRVEEVKPGGGGAVATYAGAHDMLVFAPKDGQEHRVSYQGKWRVTLQKRAEGWRLSRSVEPERRVLRDGVLIDQWPKSKSRP